MTARLLLEILEELETEQFDRFKWSLQQPDIMQGFAIIAKSRLEKANRMGVVDLLVQTYTLPPALEVTKRILTDIKSNTLVERLTTVSSRPKGPSPVGEDLPGALSAKQRLLSARKDFSQRVSEPLLKTLVDELLQQRVLSPEEMESALAQSNRADKARAVIDMVRNKGEEPCSIMITVLCEEDRYLSKELKLT